MVGSCKIFMTTYSDV